MGTAFKHGRKGGVIRVEQQRKEGDEPEGCLPCLYDAFATQPHENKTDSIERLHPYTSL